MQLTCLAAPKIDPNEIKIMFVYGTSSPREFPYGNPHEYRD